MTARLTLSRATPRSYRHLWLKYVTGIDLTQHCARSLHGRYSRHIKADTTEATLDLDEFPAPFGWYLCGVTTDPTRWEDNPHLALIRSPYHKGEMTLKDLDVTFEGIRPTFDWGEHSIAENDPRRHLARYRTCRNWQYAHHLRARGVPDIRGDRPRGSTGRATQGQLSIKDLP
ncbi:hypothetical protein [Streptomyces sp. NPDC088925]|uniref:hypothetical protein n=1 Tax=Streptomyces sp. NPDC088925 TaxID=3365914 RepID=UPI00380625AF